MEGPSAEELERLLAWVPFLEPLSEGERSWLAVRLAFTALEEADALALGLELFEDWEAAARQQDNEPLLELLERARAEFLCTPGACQ